MLKFFQQWFQLPANGIRGIVVLLSNLKAAKNNLIWIKTESFSGDFVIHHLVLSARWTRKEVNGREIHLVTTSRPLQFFVEVWIFAAHWFTGEYSIVQTSFSVLQLPQLNRSLLATWLNLQTNYPPATFLFSHFHSVSYLCAHALTWSEVFFFLFFWIYCTVCLEQTPLQC